MGAYKQKAGVYMRILDEKLEENWKNYLWQGSVAGLSIILISTILADILNFVLIAAVGSTSFVIFALPLYHTATPRSVIGGHALCIFAGISCSYLAVPGVEGGLAVAVGFFLMVVTNTEHPPAAGTALALAESPLLKGALFVLASAFLFSALRSALLPKLKDLA